MEAGMVMIKPSGSRVPEATSGVSSAVRLDDSAWRSVRVCALWCGMIIVLMGCSGESPDASSPGVTDESGLSPLEEILEEIYAGWGDEEVRAEASRREEVVAECMQAQGFEYYPGAAAEVLMNPAQLEALPGTLEYAEQYGYGLATDPWGMRDVLETPTPDPNEAYLANMSAREREAYDVAMFGEWAASDAAENGDASYGWSDSGCSGLADHEVYETAPGLDEGALAELKRDMSLLFLGVDDPRLAALDDQWAECMAEGGYSGLYTVPEAEASIRAQLEAIIAVGTDVTDPAAQAAATEGAAEAAEEQLEDLASVEVAVATADFSCREEVGYSRLAREIELERQTEFYEAHREELEAWRDAVREAVQ